MSLEDRILLDEGFFILLLAEYAVSHLRGFTQLYYSIPIGVGKGGVGEAPTEKPTHFTNDLGMLYQKQSVPHHVAIQTTLEMQHSQSHTKSVCSAIISLLDSYRRYCSLADAALPL